MRDVIKTHKDYINLVNKSKNRRGAFTRGEIEQIIKASNNTCDSLFYALSFGFMAGYRLAKREARKSSKA